MPQHIHARKGPGITRTQRVTSRTVRGAFTAVRLRAALVRQDNPTPAVPSRDRASCGRDHTQPARAIGGKRFTQIVSQTGNAPLGCYDVSRKRSRHAAEGGRSRGRSLLPVTQLSMRITKPGFQLRRTTRELL
jgi:hypothetical protein